MSRKVGRCLKDVQSNLAVNPSKSLRYGTSHESPLLMTINGKPKYFHACSYIYCWISGQSRKKIKVNRRNHRPARRVVERDRRCRRFWCLAHCWSAFHWPGIRDPVEGFPPRTPMDQWLLNPCWLVIRSDNYISFIVTIQELRNPF